MERLEAVAMAIGAIGSVLSTVGVIQYDDLMARTGFSFALGFFLSMASVGLAATIAEAKRKQG